MRAQKRYAQNKTPFLWQVPREKKGGISNAHQEKVVEGARKSNMEFRQNHKIKQDVLKSNLWERVKKAMQKGKRFVLVEV